ncbi:MAG: ATP synthase subunit I [Cyanobacteria bacterium J06641_5]
MNDWMLLWLSAILGTCLGIFYFGSLWITVRQLPTTQWPVRIFIGSYLGRLAIAGLGFYLLANGSWQRAVAGLGGFILARTVSIERWRPRRDR